MNTKITECVYVHSILVTFHPSVFVDFIGINYYDVHSFNPLFFILDKKAACLTLGGYLKTFRVTLLECEIECCDSSNCNTQKLSLTQDAVRVFPPGNKN